jgi:hypothetical protein
VIRAFGLLLVIVLAVSATRDIVCQLACAEPHAAHATATCHESGDVAGTLVQAIQDHCSGLQSTPALTGAKINAVHKGTAVGGYLKPAPPYSPITALELPAMCGFSHQLRTAVLRI